MQDGVMAAAARAELEEVQRQLTLALELLGGVCVSCVAADSLGCWSLCTLFCLSCRVRVWLCGPPALFPAHHSCCAPPPRPCLNADPPTPLPFSSSPSSPSSSSSSSAREEEIDDLRLTMQEQKQVFRSQIEALVAK